MTSCWGTQQKELAEQIKVLKCKKYSAENCTPNEIQCPHLKVAHQRKSDICAVMDTSEMRWSKEKKQQQQHRNRKNTYTT